MNCGIMKLKIPFKTPTINHLYFNWNNRRILTKKAKELKIEIKEVVKKQLTNEKFNENEKLKINIDIYEDWYCKNGSIKRKDISNREKFLVDSIFDAININDKQIFKHTMNKIQSDKEFSIVEINKI